MNGEWRSYSENFAWIAPATLLGLPATAVPLGTAPDGLPFACQAIAAPFEDATSLRFASAWAKRFGGLSYPEL